MLPVLLACVVAGALLAGCGRSAGSASWFQSADLPTSLMVSSSAPTLLADGSGSVTIVATATRGGQKPIPGVAVTFISSAGGALVVTGGVTNASGVATALLKSDAAVAGSRVTVTATMGDSVGRVQLSVIDPGQTAFLAQPRS